MEAAQIALAHFSGRLAVETDAADVAAALADGPPDFVLVDARSRDAYARGHLPGAISLPHAEIDERSVGRAAARARGGLLLGAGLQRRGQGGAPARGARAPGQGDAWGLRVLGSGGPSRRGLALEPFAPAAAFVRLRASASSSASDSSSIVPNSSRSGMAS